MDDVTVASDYRGSATRTEVWSARDLILRRTFQALISLFSGRNRAEGANACAGIVGLLVPPNGKSF